jgi:NADH-quinone oxidoreductase subunit D
MGIIFPLGPYHPALSEPLALRLRLRGERVTSVEEPAEGATGYSYRGALELTEGLSLDDALVILERVCARAGQSYRLALCLAVEKIIRPQLSRPAQLVRTLFAELERLNSALWTLGEIARAVDQRRLWVESLEQRERVFAAALAATGERAFWGVALPGGVREGITLEPLRDFASSASALYEQWRASAAIGGGLRRATEGLGRQATGSPADGALESAAVYGASIHDARREAPYDAYRMMTLDWAPLDALDSAPLDAAASVARLVAGMKLSVDIILTCLEELDGEPNLPRAALKLTAGEGTAAAQSPHGPARVTVTLEGDGSVVALALKTPAAQIIAQAPSMLAGRALGEAPALLAALDLCPSCAEL